MPRLAVLTLVTALCAGSHAGATSYPPVTFDELIARADVIFIGEVIDARPFELVTREGTSIIKTRVVFRVADSLLGRTSTLEAFDFFGGELNGVGMAIADMPKFAVGDRRVVFARRERSINPVVGFTHGLLRISRDGAGVDRVSTLEGVPVTGPESIGRPAGAASARPAIGMRLSDLRDRVDSALVAARRR